VGQQEVHEYEALRGCPGGCLYCWLILFCQSLQTILRIILDTTYQNTMYSNRIHST
jgi:DNA repair photolyase